MQLARAQPVRASTLSRFILKMAISWIRVWRPTDVLHLPLRSSILSNLGKNPSVNTVDDLVKLGCGANAKCTSMGKGAFACQCHDGYDGLGGPGIDFKPCRPINPCTSSESSLCQEHSRCEHTGPGAHKCVCKLGYKQVVGGACAPVDNCKTGAHQCKANSLCQMTGPGTNVCKCKSGYEAEHSLEPFPVCKAIFNCVSSRHDCSDNAQCTHVGPGAHTCKCNPGWTGSGKACETINRCLEAEPVCGVHASCTYLSPGMHQCKCEAGYAGADGCKPVNKCVQGTHMCDVNANCNYTGPGKHTCTCKEHFTATGKNGTTCTEVDNCKLGKNVSMCADMADCVFFAPGFNNCTCKSGFFGSGNVCTRENPCEVANGGCNANGKCQMSRPGKSTCACNMGFKGDGFACRSEDAPAGTVEGSKAAVTLGMDFAFVSVNRAAFDKALAMDVASAIGLRQSAVSINTVVAGSVVVGLQAMGVKDLAKALNAANFNPTELTILNGGPVTFSKWIQHGSVMSVPELEGPLQVLDVKHFLDTDCDVKSEYKSHVAMDMAAALSVRKEAIAVHSVTKSASNEVAVLCTITMAMDRKAVIEKLKGAAYPSLVRVCKSAVAPGVKVTEAEKDPKAKPNECLAKNGGCHEKASCAWLSQDSNPEKTVKCTCSPGFAGDGTLLGSGCKSTCKACPATQQNTCSPDAQCCMKLGKGATLTEHTCACKVGFVGNGVVCVKA